MAAVRKFLLAYGPRKITGETLEECRRQKVLKVHHDNQGHSATLRG